MDNQYHNLLSTLFNESLDAILVLDLKTQKFILSNQKALDLYNYTKEEFKEITPKDLTLEFITPERELLIAMKFHSGRLSDIRDIVALMPCNKEKLKQYLLKGDIEKLKKCMKKQASFLDKPQFNDSFKGIFGPFSYKEEEVSFARDLVRDVFR